jgi:hypothetical protein
VNSKLINLKYDWGYILLRTADWKSYWTDGSSMFDASDDTGEGVGESTGDSSLTLSPAEVEGTD